MIERRAWKLVEPDAPLQEERTRLRTPGAGEVTVQVAGCGVCHTDLGFYHGHVPPRGGLPLVLGHEIAGTVVEAGTGAEKWLARDVVVPAVIPCGECDFCRAGRGNICKSQFMPGNDGDGGFATHVTVPATGLTAVDDLPGGYVLADLSVIADAVTTPLQAVERAGIAEGDFAVVVGAGGVGTYAVQIAAARGATVVAIDINPMRLDLLEDHGAAGTIDATDMAPRDVKAAVREHAERLGFPRHSWKILECSGTVGGQQSAYALLCPAATLAVVGYTHRPVELRLSNLMAFDADAFGSWGCPPELYPEAVRLVVDGEIDLRPFVRRMPMERIRDAFEITDEASGTGRIVLTP